MSLALVLALTRTPNPIPMATCTVFEQTHVHQVYESIAKAFDTTRFCYWDAVKQFLDALPPRAVVLDDGCGNGKYLRYPGRAIQWVGNDICANLLKCCQDKMPAADGGCRHDLVQANGLHLPYRKGFFDAAISIAVLHHLSTPDRRHAFLSEMARVLRPGGRALITVWAAEQRHKRMKDWCIQPNGDAMIPWKDIHGTVLQWRYYHLFNQQEFTELIQSIHGWHIQTLGYDHDNWYAVVVSVVRV